VQVKPHSFSSSALDDEWSFMPQPFYPSTVSPPLRIECEADWTAGPVKVLRRGEKSLVPTVN